MQAEIFSIGHEILMGEIVDTNSGYLATQLARLGLQVIEVTQLGDTIEHLTDAFARAFKRSKVIVSTGGLGPTQDDLTREAIAQVLGEKMEVQPEMERSLRAYFARRGITMPEQNVKQATLIPSAKAIPNPRGTAPGWWVESKGSIFVAMPGPPGEMKEMWVERVFPLLRERVGTLAIVTRTIKTTGLTEAGVAEKVAEHFGHENPYLGIYAKPDGIHLRIISQGKNEEDARALMRPMEESIQKAVGQYVWGYDEDTPELGVGAMLKEKHLTIALMESCTGGRLANAITDVPGASGYFKGAIIAYSNDVKIACGVDPKLIEKHGAISGEVALAMARAARQRLGADIGVSTTGVAGPDEMEGKPIGTVHIAVAWPAGEKHYPVKLPPRRELVKDRTVVAALLELSRLLPTL
jgi:nicotinamide-nucleotide amidase